MAAILGLGAFAACASERDTKPVASTASPTLSQTIDPWRPGAKHDVFPNITASEAPGTWLPDPGYRLIHRNYLSTQWVAGLAHPTFPDFTSGAIEGDWEHARGARARTSELARVATQVRDAASSKTTAPAPSRIAPRRLAEVSFRVAKRFATETAAGTAWLQARRPANWWLGRAASFYVHVDGRELGVVDNGECARFELGKASRGDVRVECKSWMGLSDNTVGMHVEDGDVAICEVDVGWWGPSINESYVEASYTPNVVVFNNSREPIMIGDAELGPDSHQYFDFRFRVRSSEVVRIAVDVGQRSFPLFVSPVCTPILLSGTRPLSVGEFVQQTELARAHHFAEASDLKASLTRYAQDLEDLVRVASIPQNGAIGEFIESERHWTRTMTAIADSSVMSDLLVNLGMATAQCALQALFTMAPPTRVELVAEAAGAVVEAGWDKISREFDLDAAEQRAAQAREQAWSAIIADDDLVGVATYRKRALARGLVGSWQRADLPAGAAGVRSMQVAPNGTLKMFADRTETGRGTFLLRDELLTIRWPLGGRQSYRVQTDGTTMTWYPIDQSGNAAKASEYVWSRSP